MTGCDAYPAPVPYEKSLQARDTTPARTRTFAGSSGRPRKPRVVTVSHQPTTPQHTQLSLAVTCVATHSKQVNSEPYAMLAKPQQHGNTSDDEGIPTNSAADESYSFFRASAKIHKLWWFVPCSLACFNSFSSDPSIDDTGRPSKPRAVAADDSTPCPRRSYGKTHLPHVFCILPLLSITCRERAPRWIATPLATSRKSTTRPRTR